MQIKRTASARDNNIKSLIQVSVFFITKIKNPVSPRFASNSEFLLSNQKIKYNISPDNIHQLKDGNYAMDLSGTIPDLGFGHDLENWIRSNKLNIINLKIQRCQLITSPSFLNPMINIRELDISQNAIANFNQSLCSLIFLQKLDLSNNLINKIDGDIKQMRSLKNLNLQNNYLKKIICLKEINLSILNVDINPIQEICSCIQSIQSLQCEWTSYLISIPKGKKCQELEMSTYLKNIKEPMNELMVRACQQQNLGTIELLIKMNPELILIQVKFSERKNNNIISHIETLVQHCYRKQFIRSFKILILKGALSHPKNQLETKFNPQMNTLLQLAVLRLDLEYYNFFISIGQDFTLLDDDGNNLLHILFQIFNKDPRIAGQLAIKLLSIGIDPNFSNFQNWSPIHIAIEKEQNEALVWANEYNKGPSCFPKFDFHKTGGKNNQGALHLAAYKGNAKILMFLEQQNLSVFTYDTQGLLPKQVCTQKKCAQLLLRRFEKNEIRNHLYRMQEDGRHPSSGIKVVPFIQKHRKSQSMQAEDEMEYYCSLKEQKKPSHLKSLNQDFSNFHRIKAKTGLDSFESEPPSPTDNDMNELPKELDMALGLQIPISIEKQSLVVINNIHLQDFLQRILLNPYLVTLLNDLKSIDSNQEELNKVIFITNILFYRANSKTIMLKTIDETFTSSLKTLKFLPSLQPPVQSDQVNEVFQTNKETLEEFLIHYMKKFNNQIQKEAVLLNDKLRCIQHPLQICQKPYLPIMEDLQNNLHQNLRYDISNPYNDLPEKNIKNYLNLLSLLQNNNTSKLYFKLSTCECNRLCVIHFESLQNYHVSKWNRQKRQTASIFSLDYQKSKSQRSLTNKLIFLNPPNPFHTLNSPNQATASENNYSLGNDKFHRQFKAVTINQQKEERKR